MISSNSLIVIPKYHSDVPDSMTNGASLPINIATTPAPPVGLAGPFSYKAMSPATTKA